MGVQGTLEYLSDLLSRTKKKKKKQTQTVSLKIRMDCEGCARKVKHVLSGVKGTFSFSSIYASFHSLKIIASFQIAVAVAVTLQVLILQ